MKSPNRLEPADAQPHLEAKLQYVLAGGVGMALLIAAIYWPTLGNGFVSDDDLYVKDTAKLASSSGLRDIWFKLGATPQYYPLVHTVLWGEFHLWGLAPRGYHLANMVFHLAVALLLWRLLTRLAVPGAWLGAALFAVHPVQVETVAWASEQKNLLSAAFALAAILAYLWFESTADKPAAGQRGEAYATALVLFLCALLCKTVVIVTPAVILVLGWWKRGRVTRREVWLLVPFFALGLALAAVTVWMEKTHVGATGAAWQIPLVDRVLIAGRAVWFYAGKLVWPYPLVFTYPRWHIDTTVWWQWLYPVAAVGVLVALWALRRRIGRGPLAAALLYVGVLAPALGFFDVFPFVFSFVADHYQYHASMAALAALAAGGVIVARRIWPALSWPESWPAFVPAAVAIGLLAILAHRQVYAYEDDETLIRESIRRCPQSWAAQYRLANVLSQEGDAEGALEHYREAARLFPEYKALHNNIGIALAALGQLDAAIAEHELALQGDLHPDDRARAHFRIATVRAQQGREDEAIASYRATLEVDPNHAHALFNLGVLLMQRGEVGEAIDLFRRTLASDPQALPARRALAEALAQSGQTAEAIAELERALAKYPDDARLHEQLAGVLLQTEALAEAESHLWRSIQIEPTAGAHNLLGVIFGSRDDLNSAIEHFRAALAIDPSHPGAAENLRKAEAARQSP